MPLIPRDVNRFLQYFTSGHPTFDEIHRLNTGNCSDFAKNLIEAATERRVTNANQIFQGRGRPSVFLDEVRFNLLNYGRFHSLPSGSLLGVAYGAHTNRVYIGHYVVKRGDSSVIGANHGGFFYLEEAGPIGVVNISPAKFNGIHFNYDPPTPSAAFRLVEIAYDLS